MKKHHFTYTSRFGLTEAPELEKKQLAELSCDIGCICEFDCPFCYAQEASRNLKHVRAIIKEGYAREEFSLYRTRDNVLRCLERDLKKTEPGDKRTVFFCPSCDPCSTPGHVGITTEAIRLIMERSDLQVRVLSKSCLILDVARALLPYKERITYGLSTGTIRHRTSAAMELGASPVRWRLQTLRLLQEEGYRTYGMLSPMLATQISPVAPLLEAIRPDKCETIWAEFYNPRNSSTIYEMLSSHGLSNVGGFVLVIGNPESWFDYSRALFIALRKALREMGAEKKLRYLHYMDRDPERSKKYFERKRGVVCL